MTFSTKVKEEIASHEENPISAFTELSSFIRFDGVIKKNEIILTIENAKIARRIYQFLKISFNIKPKIIVRIQKRFRVKQIYIISITDNVSLILEKLGIYKNKKKTLAVDYLLANDEEKTAFLRGLFLATGSINNPSTSGYHMEFNIETKKEALYIIKLLKEFNITSKCLKRNNNYMVYIKSAEMISDLLKRFNAINCMFYFEDIRIYRDHKNMVNRLNNCEIDNKEKTIATGLKQLEDIKYLEDNDLITLLDDKIKEAIIYRKKYPETSYQELAEIISQETSHQITKSCVNHYFRKIKSLVDAHKNKNGLKE